MNLDPKSDSNPKLMESIGVLPLTFHIVSIGRIKNTDHRQHPTTKQERQELANFQKTRINHL